MFLTSLDKYEHTRIGVCTFVGESREYDRYDIAFVECQIGTKDMTQLYPVQVDDLSIIPFQERKGNPLVIRGQGPFRITIEEGDI